MPNDVYEKLEQLHTEQEDADREHRTSLDSVRRGNSSVDDHLRKTQEYVKGNKERGERYAELLEKLGRKS